MVCLGKQLDDVDVAVDLVGVEWSCECLEIESFHVFH